MLPAEVSNGELVVDVAELCCGGEDTEVKWVDVGGWAGGTKGGWVACREGQAARREGQVARREGQAACREGQVACREGQAARKEGQAALVMEKFSSEPRFEPRTPRTECSILFNIRLGP